MQQKIYAIPWKPSSHPAITTAPLPPPPNFVVSEQNNSSISHQSYTSTVINCEHGISDKQQKRSAHWGPQADGANWRRPACSRSPSDNGSGNEWEGGGKRVFGVLDAGRDNSMCRSLYHLWTAISTFR